MPATDYPYKIPLLDYSTLKSGLSGCPINNVNEFFLIEFLLRSAHVQKIYRKSHEEFNSIWKDHGLFSQAPLSGSHHALLLPDDKLKQVMAQLGYVDTSLGILDLGVVWTLPPQHKIAYESATYYGPYDGGETECLFRLKASNPQLNPRSLCLRIDTIHAPKAILSKLLPLLRERHKSTMELLKEREAPAGKHYPFRIRSIAAWTDYLQCHDLRYQTKLTFGEIGKRIYGKTKNATDQGKKAVSRVEKAIAAAEKFLPAKFIANHPFGFITLPKKEA